MITIFTVDTFDLTEYEWSLFQIETYADPDYNDQGYMLIRVEGEIGTPKQRLALIDGVVPSCCAPPTNLVIGADEMPENGTTLITPRMQSIPANHKFVLVWESKTPYFTGIESGEKYRL